MDIEKCILITFGILFIIYLVYKYRDQLKIYKEEFEVQPIGNIYSAGEGNIRLIGLNDNWMFDESWISNGYRRPSVLNQDGIVYLSGRVQGKGVQSGSNNIIGHLPRGYWPDSRLVYHIGPKIGSRIDILKNGSIMYITGKGDPNGTYIDLDPISFTSSAGTQLQFNVHRKCHYVRIILPKNGYLSLAEVQVFDKTGKQISKHKTASQSSIGWGGNAGRAVDGNISGKWRNRSVTHTRRGTNNFWMVDLKGGHDVKNVMVYNRTDCCDGRITGAKIQLLDEGKGEIASKVWDPKDYIDVGKVTSTVSGRRCQNWRSSRPHRHPLRYTSSGGIGNHNYCRNVLKKKVTTSRRVQTSAGGTRCNINRNRWYNTYNTSSGSLHRRYGYCNRGYRWRGYTTKQQCRKRCKGKKFYFFGNWKSRCRWKFNWRRWRWYKTNCKSACYCVAGKKPTYKTVYSTRTVYEPRSNAPLACFTNDPKVKFEKCAVNGKSNLSYRKKIYPAVKNFSFNMTGEAVPSGWSNYSKGSSRGGYRYCNVKKTNNFIVLSGLAKYKSRQWPVPSVIGIIPKEFRPKYTRSFNQTNHNGNVRIQVETDGRVIVDRGSKSQLARYYGWISLTGLQWPVNYQGNSINLPLSRNVRPANQLSDGRLLSGAVFKLRQYNGSGSGSGYSAGVSNRFNTPGDQTIAMWVNVQPNGRQNPIAKAYGGDGTITIEPTGSISYYYGRSGRNSSPYVGFYFKGVKWGVPTHFVITRKNKYVWATRYVWRRRYIRRRRGTVRYRARIRYRKYVNTTVKGYINGKLKKTQVFNMEPRSSQLPLLIGRGYVNPLKGEINNLLLYNRCISQEEVFSVKGLTVGEDVNYGPPIAIRNNKLITLSGVLMPNPIGRSGTQGGDKLIATLPGHFRPNRTCMFTVNYNEQSLNVYIDDSGRIYYRSPDLGSPTFVSLDGISYLTYK